MRMRRLASVAAVFVLAVLPGCQGDDVDTNPGKGDDGVGDVKPGDEGDEGDDGY